MIDIHSHILPQIDDGAQDWDESLAMIRQGIRDGIEGAICTPHVLNVLDEPFESKVLFKFQQLKELIDRHQLNFKVWLGSEIHCQAIFNSFSKLVTLNGTQKYLLMELPMAELPADAGDKLFKLNLEGITPILAHPERNSMVIQRLEVAFQFIQQGALVQLNAGSLTGDFGRTVRKTAFEMMDHDMVHVVASDCHNAGSRPMLLRKSYQTVANKWGTAKAVQLFITNPQKVVQGEKVELREPMPPSRKTPFIKRIFGSQKA